MIKERDIERVLDACHIEDVISDFVKLTKKGSRYVACCPVHNERTPSFVVTPSKNMYKCFSSGCGISGNAISFLMDVQHMSFPDAIKYLADKYGIRIEEDKTPLTTEERNERLEREAILNANTAAAKFFADCIHLDEESSRNALEYASKRWSKEFVDEVGIGFAPGHSKFLAWATKEGFSKDILLKAGLLRQKDGRTYDAYYDRVTIPIRDKYTKVIGFTARAIGDAQPKYINSPESCVYKKSESVFGINNATRAAASEEKFYLVEGGPDVLRLHSIGVYNAVASLGSAWTTEQFKQLKRYSTTICFIPDIDPPKEGELFGAGIKGVIKNSLLAFSLGFNITVKEIENKRPSEKIDPDSYIKSRKVLDSIPEKDFVIWYAEKLIEGKETTIDRTIAVKKIAALLATSGDSIRVKLYVKELSKLYGAPANLWQNAIDEAGRKDSGKKENRSKFIDQDLYKKYGFFERDNCYYSMSGDADEREWSNFKMQPLFHIKDQLNPKRLFRITNANKQEEIIELKQEDLVSLKGFKLRVEGLGNYIWKAKEEQLTKLKGFLYESTETAVEVTQLGWQRDGFFAFGNGIQYLGQWHPTDEFGIVRLGDVGNFYLPAASQIYRNERKLFQFERRFVHTQFNNVSLRNYSDRLIEVFGDNAIVGLCFYWATLFRDIVTGITKNFPLLNLFGPKGSGKSELGHSLMAFFIIDNTPPNIQNSTDAALAETVAQCSNALVHLDEYKNSIELSRREFLKALYDGIGRTRMNMDRDKKRETTSVDCGVIVSGQEMPTIDIAIFSRMLFCSFDKTEFTAEEKQKFDKLAEIRKQGCSHITLDLLRHRKKFEAEFAPNYKIALSDLLEAVKNESVEDRILRNWVVPLAAFRTLMSVIDVAFDYKRLLTVCTKACIRQASECRSNNELANFWQVVDFLHQNGEIFIDADYRIRYENSFKGKGMKSAIEFHSTTPVLYLCTKRVMMLYKKNGKAVGDNTLPTESLRYYLENSKEYLGLKNAMRFKNFTNARDSMTQAEKETGNKYVSTVRTDWALAFDYRQLSENYHINLEVEAADESSPDPADIDTEDKSLPY